MVGVGFGPGVVIGEIGCSLCVATYAYGYSLVRGGGEGAESYM